MTDPLDAQVIAERLSVRCDHFVLMKGFRIQKGLPFLRPRRRRGTVQLGYSRPVTQPDARHRCAHPHRSGPLGQ